MWWKNMNVTIAQRKGTLATWTKGMDATTQKKCMKLNSNGNEKHRPSST